MAAKTAAPQRPEQILQRLEAKKIDGFVRDFEARLRSVTRLAELAPRRGLRRRGDLRGLLRIDEAFVGQSFGEFVEQILDGLIVHRLGVIQHFAQLVAHRAVRQQVAFLQRAENCFPQRFHRAFGIHLRDSVELRFKSALQEKIAQALHQFFQVDGVRRFARVFTVLNEFHAVP